MLLTICVVEKLYFFWQLSSRTCDLGSLVVLSNRADSLVTSVPSNMISYIHRVAVAKRFTGCVSTWL